MIYLDHAATSFPKPLAVEREVMKCLHTYGGNPGRGAHPLAMAAAEKIYECRTVAAELFGVADPERVFFTLNTTHGLNTVLKGLLKKGDHVLLSDLEHNAVWRPLWRMEQEGFIRTDRFESFASDASATALDICAAIERRIGKGTKMVVCTAASNLCSAALPLRQIGALCRRRGILFVVDGAQGAGHMPISVDEWGIDALCLPGHKGLLGPQGCGMVLLGKGVSPETLTEGGNGVYSLEGGMTDQLPERYEAGTLPTPAIAGLCRGMKLVSRVGVKTIDAYERALFRRTAELLGNTPGVTLYAPHHVGSILLFNLDGRPADEVGAYLAEQGICVRSGYHCSALGHRALGTPEGGAVRVSFGLTNRPGEPEALWRALRGIIS